MSARLLLVYHSVEGQTARVAERIAEIVRNAGDTIDVYDADDAPPPDTGTSCLRCPWLSSR